MPAVVGGSVAAGGTDTTDSNSEAAKRVSAMDASAAAIAASTAAAIYGLKVLANNIEDESDNTTRFLVIGRQNVGPSGVDKTALLVATKNKPALYSLYSNPG